MRMDFSMASYTGSPGLPNSHISRLELSPWLRIMGLKSPNCSQRT